MTVEKDTDYAATLADRRRPGRPDSVNPKLLPLLRAEERARLPQPDADSATETEVTPWPSDRRLHAGEGVVVGMAIGALLWAAIIGGAWAALG